MSIKISSCAGVPVRYDDNATSASIILDRSRWWWPWRITQHPCLCEQRGIWRWREIVIGRAFLAFPPREQQAILMHEVGHVRLRHVRERLLSIWLIFCLPNRFALLCQRQEYEADQFAAKCGFGPDLASAFGRFSASGAGALHPELSDRIERLNGA